MAEVSALTVAKYFLSLGGDDAGDLMSNLKLQKLLYYSQGCWVALNGTTHPLFDDKIYAWKHGPVVKAVYSRYASYRDGAIPPTTSPKLAPAIQSFLDEIYRVFGKFSAWKLRARLRRCGLVTASA